MKLTLASLLLFGSTMVHTQTWEFLGLGGENIYAIAIDGSNPQIVYAGSTSDFNSGNTGSIFKSSNAGASWDTLLRGVNVFGMNVHPSKPQTIYATLGTSFLGRGRILKSTDSGGSWFEADSGIYSDFDGGPEVLSINPQFPETLFVGTNGYFGGGLYRSSDGGMHWALIGGNTRLADGVSAIGVNKLNTQEIYAGIGDGLMKTTDGGTTWTHIPLPAGVLSMQFGRDTSTVYVGCAWEPGGFYSSSNSGASWQSHTAGLSDTTEIDQIQVLSDSSGDHLFIANGGQPSGVFRAGEDLSWGLFGEFPSRTHTIALAERTLYAGAVGIYKAEVLTGVRSQMNIPISLALYQNYPNPFNPETTISYQLQQSSRVVLRIFDVLGRELAVLVNGFQLPGKYSIRFDGSALSSGVYLIRLESNRLTMVRRMVLVK